VEAEEEEEREQDGADDERRHAGGEGGAAARLIGRREPQGKRGRGMLVLLLLLLLLLLVVVVALHLHAPLLCLGFFLLRLLPADCASSCGKQGKLCSPLQTAGDESNGITKQTTPTPTPPPPPLQPPGRSEEVKWRRRVPLAGGLDVWTPMAWPKTPAFAVLLWTHSISTDQKLYIFALRSAVVRRKIQKLLR
jgi:hypothetical protein